MLLDQLKSAGVIKSTLEDKLEESDKTALLDYLRKEHGAEQAPKSKITLTRKSNTEIKKTDSSGRARTIQVEVRKKRVLERPEDTEQTPAPQELPIEELVEEVVSIEPVLAEVVVEEIIVAEEPVIEAVEVEPPVEVKPEPVAEENVAAKSTTIKKQVLTPEQIAIREQEAKRHATLAAMQAEDVRKKQELIQRRLDEEARKLAEAEAAKLKAAKLSEGTLHKPAAKEGAVAKPAASKDAKKAKGNNKEWTDAENKKRGLKTRGAVTTGSNWRSPKCRLRRLFMKYWCQKPLLWPNWRTKWPLNRVK